MRKGVIVSSYNHVGDYHRKYGLIQINQFQYSRPKPLTQKVVRAVHCECLNGAPESQQTKMI